MMQADISETKEMAVKTDSQAPHFRLIFIEHVFAIADFPFTPKNEKTREVAAALTNARNEKRFFYARSSIDSLGASYILDNPFLPKSQGHCLQRVGFSFGAAGTDRAKPQRRERPRAN
jgi:hypothetical protein